MPPRLRKLLLPFVLVLGFRAEPTAAVELRDVALAAAGLVNIPEIDMNAVARSVGQFR